MFIRDPFKAPPGSVTSYEVRYVKGRKPFATQAEAVSFATEQRAEGGWASINQIVSIEVEARS